MLSFTLHSFVWWFGEVGSMAGNRIAKQDEEGMKEKNRFFKKIGHIFRSIS